MTACLRPTGTLTPYSRPTSTERSPKTGALSLFARRGGYRVSAEISVSSPRSGNAPCGNSALPSPDDAYTVSSAWPA